MNRSRPAFRRDCAYNGVSIKPRLRQLDKIMTVRFPERSKHWPRSRIILQNEALQDCVNRKNQMQFAI